MFSKRKINFQVDSFALALNENNHTWSKQHDNLADCCFLHV